MAYFYNYRVGSIVSKKGLIETITIEDLIAYHKYPIPTWNFTPIELTEKVILSYGFQKQALTGNLDIYLKKRIVLEKKSNSDIFFCSNISPFLPIKYLHELQDFYNINTFLSLTYMQGEIMEFISYYGSILI